MLAQPGMAIIHPKLASAKAAHRASGHHEAHNRVIGKLAVASLAEADTVALPSHGPDHFGTQPGAQAADVHVDHVGCGARLIAPHPGEQVLLRDHLAAGADELP